MRPYRWIRPILFRMEPEKAHGLTVRMLELAGYLPPVCAIMRKMFGLADQGSRVRVMGIDFPNPVGLAAGYDKDGRALRGITCLGFGHIELGTVTPKPQIGNPKPRIFRLPEDQAVINRMGFPNHGAEVLLKRLQSWHPKEAIIGVSIGKNEDTPIEAAAQDYVHLLSIFYPYADYLAVNISCPNQIGLRSLQARNALEDLLAALNKARQDQESKTGRHVPLMVKLSPDLSDLELDDAVSAIMDAGFDGVIATNTTSERNGLRFNYQEEEGGLSGLPLRQRSTAIIRRIYERTSGRLPIIGVGGIFGFEDARSKLDAGASLVQVYTGLIYQGPSLTREILQGLKDSHSRQA